MTEQKKYMTDIMQDRLFEGFQMVGKFTERLRNSPTVDEFKRRLGQRFVRYVGRRVFN